MPDDVYDVNKRPYHHGDLRRALVESASALLDEGGIEALSLRAVAGRAGVSAMAPYRHFADKAALLAAVAEHGFERLRARLGEASLEGRDVRRVLVAQGVAYVRFAADNPDLYRLMFTGPPAWRETDTSGLAQRPDTTFGLLTAELAALVPAGELDMAMLTVWSFIHGLASLVIDRRLTPLPPDVEALTRRVTAFFGEKVFGGEKGQARFL
jgi:AcrR family transcriptional regulator